MVKKYLQKHPETVNHQLKSTHGSFQDLHNNVDLASTLKCILETVLSLISADRCSIFLLDKEKQELYTFAFDISKNAKQPKRIENYFTEKQNLLSPRDRLRLVRSNTMSDADRAVIERAHTLAESLSRRVSTEVHEKTSKIRIPVGSGIAGHVAQTKKPLNIPDAYKDSRFSPEVDKMTGYHTKQILCMPIFAPVVDPSVEPEFLGVASLINKKDKSSTSFGDAEIEIFSNILKLVGISIKSANMFEESLKTETEAIKLAVQTADMFEKTKNQMAKADMLIKLARMLYAEDKVENIVATIVNMAKEIMLADKASVFIVDKEAGELYSSVFDNGTEKKITTSIDKGVAGYVARTGETVNLANAYDDPRFNPAVDMMTNYKTVSMMCVPLYDPSGEVIGVANLINKTNTKIDAFSAEDQKQFEDVALFCGLALSKAIMNKRMDEQRHRLAIAMDLMSYHASVSQQEIDDYKAKEASLMPQLEKMREWTFDAHHWLFDNDHLVAMVHNMFTHLKYGETFDILDDHLVNYILVVRRNYRPVAYHNFAHATSVAHTVYLFILNGLLDPYMDKLELFSMLVAALNHDIDHRGTNNQFQKIAHTDLAKFYDNSTMERHHFNHAMAVLNSGQGINILSKLTKEDYKKSLKYIESSILATDLALFFQNQKKLKPLLQEKAFEPKTNLEHKELLRGLIMTCADLGAMYKPWDSSRKTADLVYEEFFVQGDQEKALGVPYSSELTDRSKLPEIPRMQLGFYSFVVLPAFETLKLVMEDKVDHILQQVQANKKGWQDLKESGKPYVMGE
ncbi:hypothetical protein EDD86DRAFT_204492 [Gorgonomyces haynaldii]|nr:hypothetical protein EDD86DRAFT_204492 [Gorgonomyces haynaldii]